MLEYCSPMPGFYFHSESKLLYFHLSIKNIFEIIRNVNSKSTSQFGVISAQKESGYEED
jgi:hypothetical protein